MTLVAVQRDLLLALRSEYRAITGHWAEGFTSDGAPLVVHDQRMPDGECLSCTLLGLLDGALYPDFDVSNTTEARVTQVVESGAYLARRRRDRPPGMPLGRRR